LYFAATSGVCLIRSGAAGFQKKLHSQKEIGMYSNTLRLCACSPSQAPLAFPSLQKNLHSQQQKADARLVIKRECTEETNFFVALVAFGFASGN
jgi:hypothetical protein